MGLVFVLWHVHADDDDELVGVYSSETEAMRAIQRLCMLPGFRNNPELVQYGGTSEGFVIARYELDRDQWPEGHVSGDDIDIEVEH